jgi:hypothetical protein
LNKRFISEQLNGRKLMRLVVLSAFIAGILPLAAGAQSFRAINYLDVVPLSKTTFEVIEANGEGPRGIWCAAADFAEKRLRTQGRIYIAGGRGPSRKSAGSKSVVFTTDAGSLSQGPFRSISLDTSQVGVGLPVNHALQFCRTEDIEEYELGSLSLLLK